MYGEQSLNKKILFAFSLFLMSMFSSPLIAQERPVIHVEYNKTKCDYCKMFFQEKNFGAEIQTTSDSILVFDATECLAAFLIGKKIRDDHIKKIWSVDYGKPSTLVDGSTAWYIRSDKILSPMSVNIAAFGSQAEADSVFAKIGGERLDWPGVVKLVRERWFPESQKK